MRRRRETKRFMAYETIQWFPGHMAKTRRMISENLKNVDLVIEILDARIPYSSRNPEIGRLCAGKPRLILLNKASLASPEQNKLWIQHLSGGDTLCLLTDCITGEGMNRIAQAVQEILKDKIERYENKNMAGRKLFAMVLGIPNVGKSSVINKLSGNKKAKVENRPGVTVDKQWYSTSQGLDLMDMPGVLWPKFDEKRVGENLALTGAIKDQILDQEGLACVLCNRLKKSAPALLCERYKLEKAPEELADIPDYELMEMIGQKRGFLVSGGEVNTERTAHTLLEEFRSGKIGRVTLDQAPEGKKNAEL